MLEPEHVDSDLLDPTVLGDTRDATLAVIATARQGANAATDQALDRLHDVLTEDAALDREIRTALAALLKG